MTCCGPIPLSRFVHSYVKWPILCQTSCFISTDIIHIPHEKGQPTTTRLRHNVPKFERWAAWFGALDDHATISRLARLYMRQRLLDRQDLHIDEVQRPLQIG